MPYLSDGMRPMHQYDQICHVKVCAKMALQYRKLRAVSSTLGLRQNSPPLAMKQHWFVPHTAYTMAKYGMSMSTYLP